MQHAIEIKLILTIISIHFLNIAIYICLMSYLKIVFTSVLYSRIYLEKYFLHVAQMQNISRLLTSICFNFDIGFNIEIVNLVFFHLQLLLLLFCKKRKCTACQSNVPITCKHLVCENCYSDG